MDKALIDRLSLLQEESPPQLRRELLINCMDELTHKEVNCLSCSGECCTFTSNSMKVTPIESVDLILYLIEKGRWTQELHTKLAKTVKENRLDSIPGDGRRDYIRRTYTCPFFDTTRHRCTIPPRVKPYGCLAFNPTKSDLTEGGPCESDKTLLEQREKQFQKIEKKLNSAIQDSCEIAQKIYVCEIGTIDKGIK